MDNNMIRIDDLVRQHLAGGEEPERSGAWLNMRDLLDKEMPQAAGPNWRRIFGYLSLLLLLGAGSVGGYKLYQNGIGIAGGGSSAPEEPAASAITSTPTTGNPALSATIASKLPARSTAQNSNRTPAETPQRHSSNTSENATASSLNSETSNHQKAQNTPRHEASFAASNTNTTAESTSPVSKSQTVSHGHHNSQAPAQKQLQNSYAANTDATRLHALHPNNATINIPSLTQPQMAHIRHDSVQRLELVSHRIFDASVNDYVVRVDTFPMGKFARNIFLPLIPEETATNSTASQPSAQTRQPAIASKMSTTSKQTQVSKSVIPSHASEVVRDEQTLASKPATNPSIAVLTPAASATNTTVLASNKTTSRHFNFFDFERLAAVMNQVKSNLQRIELYPGLMAGINASMFTPNALGGVQAGITSLFILNDYWSLMTELKYFQRYNTGSSVRDDYKQVMNGTVNFTQVNGIDYKEYKWEDRSIRHSFNYDVIRTFELPVMMRRSWGRAYAQGGVNLVLNSAIAVTETSDTLNDILPHNELRPANHDTSPFVPNDHPLVLRSDFGPRFGIGYVLSAGFMFSPNIYVDGRITQSVWDNSKTGGAKQVAQDLLRTPSIQISVGYKFGTKQH